MRFTRFFFLSRAYISLNYVFYWPGSKITKALIDERFNFYLGWPSRKYETGPRGEIDDHFYRGDKTRKAQQRGVRRMERSLINFPATTVRKTGPARRLAYRPVRISKILRLILLMPITGGNNPITGRINRG